MSLQPCRLFLLVEQQHSLFSVFLSNSMQVYAVVVAAAVAVCSLGDAAPPARIQATCTHVRLSAVVGGDDTLTEDSANELVSVLQVPTHLNRRGAPPRHKLGMVVSAVLATVRLGERLPMQPSPVPGASSPRKPTLALVSHAHWGGEARVRCLIFFPAGVDPNPFPPRPKAVRKYPHASFQECRLKSLFPANRAVSYPLCSKPNK